ncbi:MAG: DNA-binding response regulator [Planctomycetota bacterium]|nr:MAG: DNA-binding response regulator [Planctomycetota bacterium]
MAERILLVEDDERLARLIAELLHSNGYEVQIASRGDTGLEQILQGSPDLVLLDVNLPGMDGFSVCRRVRSQYSGRIIMVTARGDDVDEVVGLELGADDYLAKPVNPRVLLARVAAVLRRPVRQARSSEKVRIGEMTVDPLRREARLDGKRLELRSAEFDLLWLLARRAGEVVSRQEIFRELRGLDYDGLDRSIDLRISRIRKALGHRAGRYIQTVRGRGYLLVREG